MYVENDIIILHLILLAEKKHHVKQLWSFDTSNEKIYVFVHTKLTVRAFKRPGEQSKARSLHRSHYNS